MKHKPIFVALILAASAISLPIAAQGHLDVLMRGRYVCALPGDASGSAWVEQAKSNFDITGASSYRSASGSGTYLLEGKRLQFSRGPFNGKTFLLMSSGLLQETDRKGSLGRMRCHRAGPLED